MLDDVLRQRTGGNFYVRLLLVLTLFTVVSNVSEASQLFPEAVPGGETVILDETRFVEACKSAIADEARELGWSFGNSILTQSDKWGLVWRVDFFLPDRAVNSALVNRAICWGQSDGTVNGKAVLFGQQIPRLG
jgi:hypothetical protein